METTVTTWGNIVNDPEYKVLPTGTTRLKFRLAHTPRRPARDGGGWVDGTSSFFTVTCWRWVADNAFESLRKGDPVLVHGRLVVREYTTEDGVRRQSTEIEARELGPNLSRCTARPHRAGRGGAAAASDGAQEGLAGAPAAGPAEEVAVPADTEGGAAQWAAPLSVADPHTAELAVGQPQP